MGKVVLEDFEFDNQYSIEGNYNTEEVAVGNIISGQIIRVVKHSSAMVKLPNGKVGQCPIEEIDTRKKVHMYSLSRMVGKSYDFYVTDIKEGTVMLSRQKLQLEVIEYYRNTVKPGSIIECRILEVKRYGLKLDVGRGLVGVLLYKDMQIHKTRRQFEEGSIIKAVYRGIFSNNVVALSTIELFGTWEENAELINQFEVRVGYVKRVTDYGAFITLAPNITGLADNMDDIELQPKDLVSVAIRNVSAPKMRVKLEIVSKLEEADYSLLDDVNSHTFIDSGRIVYWEYEPDGFVCNRRIEPIDYTNASTDLGEPMVNHREEIEA